MDETQDVPVMNERFAKKGLYILYSLMFILSLGIFVVGCLLEDYEEVVISVPVILILGDALFTEKSKIHIPPLMLILVFAFMVMRIVCVLLDSGKGFSIVTDLMLGIVLGLAGIIAVYTLLRTNPDDKTESPLLRSFMGLSIASTFFILIMLSEYIIFVITGNALNESKLLMEQLIMVIIGAVFICLLYYLNSSRKLFKYTVSHYMEANASTLGIEEYERIEIQKAIDRGEGEKVEYKSTLRTNLATGEKDPRMEKAVLKTLVAFLNSNGGTLLIGVSDDGTVIGADEGSFDNRDKMCLHLTNIISAQIGNEFLPYISFRLVDFDGKAVIRAVCRKCDTPVFLKEGKNEIFYARSGPSTVDLTGTDLLYYVNNRFSKWKKSAGRH